MSELFSVHKLNKKGLNRARAMAIEFGSLVGFLKIFCEDGREFAIAKTKLEEACFFAKKAMAVKKENQE